MYIGYDYKYCLEFLKLISICALIRNVIILCALIRSTEATAEMEELARKANPDEINIAEDDDEETQPVEGMITCK